MYGINRGKFQWDQMIDVQTNGILFAKDWMVMVGIKVNPDQTIDTYFC